MAKKFDMAALVKDSLGDVAVSKVDTVETIPADWIDVNTANFYEMSDLEELASSIELVGLLHPVAVKPAEGGRYTLIDGERRFRALTEVLRRTEIPCIIRRPVNDVVEELMLIEANRTQRKMSAADLSKQAERYQALLAQLKDAGVPIPGRLRDRVAEALQVSSTKLARLHAIRENLVPELLERFDAGAINESTAYELQQQPADAQTRIYYPEMSTRDVSDLAKIYLRFGTAICPLNGEQPCDHIEPRMKLCSEAKSWSQCKCGCCRDCYKRDICKSACPRIAAEVAAAKAAKKAEDKALKEAEAETKRKKAAEADADWARFKALRERQGLSLEDIKAADGWFSDLATEEERKVALARTVLDYFNVYNGVRRLVQMSDILGVSVEEVLGRTPKSVSESDTAPAGIAWHRVTNDDLPPDEGEVVFWGVKGLRTAVADCRVNYCHMWPAEYAWWAVVEGPEEKDDDES